MAWVMLILLLIQRVYYHGHNMQCCVHRIEGKNRTVLLALSFSLQLYSIACVIIGTRTQISGGVWVICSCHHPNLISDSPLLSLFCLLSSPQYGSLSLSLSLSLEWRLVLLLCIYLQQPEGVNRSFARKRRTEYNRVTVTWLTLDGS